MRKILDFHGGIHPPENKHQSRASPHCRRGHPAGAGDSTVTTYRRAGIHCRCDGEQVLKGQVIAEARGFVSVPKHAPTSGTIQAIEDRLIAHPSGHLAPCIVIATDGKDEWIEHQATRDYESLDKAVLLELIRNAGIAGMGGAGFPSAVKLVAAIDHSTTLIINGTECEPYITADDVLMRERARRIIEGAKILRHLIAPGETLIGVEDNKPERSPRCVQRPRAPVSKLLLSPPSTPRAVRNS